MKHSLNERGAVNTWLIVAISFIVVSVALGGVLTWALINYFDAKDNVDTKVASAVLAAKKEQADADDAKFIVSEKEPNRAFAGPADLGGVSFNYPKTWSAFVEKEASNSYSAYFNPVVVPPLSASQQFSLRVLIETKDYDQVIKTYESLVKKGDLKSSAVKAGEENGTRIDGAFSKDIRGSAVIFKIRDKTLTIRTDADVFKVDFDALVATLKFNQ